MMNAIKQFSGLIWMLLAAWATYLLLRQAGIEFARSPALDTRIFWYTIIPIFIPVMAGFGLFGYYCFKGEYSKLEN